MIRHPTQRSFGQGLVASARAMARMVESIRFALQIALIRLTPDEIERRKRAAKARRAAAEAAEAAERLRLWYEWLEEQRRRAEEEAVAIRRRHPVAHLPTDIMSPTGFGRVIAAPVLRDDVPATEPVQPLQAPEHQQARHAPGPASPHIINALQVQNAGQGTNTSAPAMTRVEARCALQRPQTPAHTSAEILRAFRAAKAAATQPQDDDAPKSRQRRKRGETEGQFRHLMRRIMRRSHMRPHFNGAAAKTGRRSTKSSAAPETLTGGAWGGSPWCNPLNGMDFYGSDLAGFSDLDPQPDLRIDENSLEF